MNAFSWKQIFRAIIILPLLGSSACTSKSTQPAPVFGVLVLEVQGLQSHLSADVTIKGPANYSRHCTDSVTIGSLAPGDYTILANAIIDTLGDTIAVNPDSQMVTVVENKAAKAQVFYQSIALGSISISVSGLPSGEPCNITVTSLDDPSLIWSLTESGLIDALKPGPYRIEVSEIVITGGETFKPDVGNQIVNVLKGAISQFIVTFSPKYGKMSVSVIGLPAGVDGDITVDGGDISTHIIERFPGNKTLDSLPEGSYWVTGAEVAATDGTPFIAKPDSVQVTVTGGQTEFVTVNYVPKFGKLDILVNGLPSDVPPLIDVRGGNGYSLLYGNETHKVIDSLEEGGYKVIGRELIAPDLTHYIAKPDTQTVTVTGGQTAYVTVNYEVKHGTLDVQVTGLPANVPGLFAVRNEQGLNQLIGGFTHKVLDTLVEANYWVIGYEVEATDGTAYVAKPDTQQVHITPGQTTFVTVAYKAKYGKIDLRVTGLPAGVQGDITITKDDNSFSAQLAGSVIIDSLLEGEYKVLSEEIVHNNNPFKPEPDSQSIYLIPPSTAIVNVKYESILGALRIDVKGLPTGVLADIFIRNEDGSMDWNVTETETIDSIPEGKYTILARDVIDGDGDTLRAVPDSVDDYVLRGITTDVSVKYVGGLSFKVFASLHDYSLTGSMASHHDNVADRVDVYDYDALLYAPIVADGCTLTAVDVTANGYQQSINATHHEGSFSLSRTLVVSEQSRSFELTEQTTMQAGVPASVGYGYVYGIANGHRGAVLQISNPKLDSVGVVIHWQVTGTATYSGNDISRAGASVHSWMHIVQGTCYPTLQQSPGGPVFNAYMDHYHNSDTTPLSGDTTIVIKNVPTYLIKFSLESKSRVDSFQEALGASHDGTGDGSGSMTVTLTVAIEKY